MNLYFNQIGNPVAGRKIEIFGKTTKSTGRLDCRSYANLMKAIGATSSRRFKPAMSRWQQSSACGGARLSCCAPAPAWPRFHVHSCPTFFAARRPLIRCTKRWGVAAESRLRQTAPSHEPPQLKGCNAQLGEGLYIEPDWIGQRKPHSTTESINLFV